MDYHSNDLWRHTPAFAQLPADPPTCPTKPTEPSIVVMKEGAVPGENQHLAYLITGGIVLACVALSPLLLVAWLTGWAWHKIVRKYSGNQNQ